MKKLLLSLCLVFLIAGYTVVCYGAPDIEATSAIMASLTSEQILYSKNPDEKIAPAEFTKLMSVYTVYKQYGLNTKITVPDNIGEYWDGTDKNMKLKAGEVLTSNDIINGMIMGQANDAAIAVALHYGGIDEFVKQMNQYASELGMADTVFKNPTGNKADGQLTTANDMLKLYRAFYNDKNLYEFLSVKNVTIPANNKSEERTYWTKNHLMSRFIYLDYIYGAATAGVSSSTEYGGYSVISSAVKGEREYVAIVLDSVRKDDVNCAMTDAQALFNHGFDDFSTVEISNKGTLMYEAKLKNNKGKNTLLLCAGKTLKARVLEGDTVESVEKEIVIDEPVKAPVKKGDVVGKMVYTYNGNLVGEVELLAESDVKRSVFKTIFGGIGWFFCLPAIKGILIAFLIIVALMFMIAQLNMRKRRRRRRNRRRNYRKY